MELSDIMTISLTDSMRKNARTMQKWRDSHRTFDTHDYFDNNGNFVDRNYIGGLGEQAVDIAFQTLKLCYKPTWKEFYCRGGDKYDGMYEEDKIDVKTTKRPFNERYFYNEKFYIRDKVLEKNTMSHFLFAVVDPDYTRAFIYGIIGFSQFMKESTPCLYTDPNKPNKEPEPQRSIQAFKLTPFRCYAFRTPKTATKF